jgi:hypothetical protein
MAEAFKNMSHDECVSLTRTIMSILDGWGLNGAAIMDVLAIPQGVPVRALRRYRENTPFPDESAIYERVEHIIGIADALRTTYPHNPPMGILWLQQKNKRFADRAPLQLIVENGLKGLLEVRQHLDCSYDWHVNP